MGQELRVKIVGATTHPVSPMANFVEPVLQYLSYSGCMCLTKDSEADFG